MPKTTAQYSVSDDKKVVTVYNIDENGVVIGSPITYTETSIASKIASIDSQIANLQSQKAGLNTNIVPLFA